MDATSVAAGLSVAAFGVIAFWLYSVAMDRVTGLGGVAPLIVVADVRAGPRRRCLLLGDGVREGWWPAIVAGLLLATTGAVVLSGDSIASPVTEAHDRTPGQAS